MLRATAARLSAASGAGARGGGGGGGGGSGASAARAGAARAFGSGPQTGASAREGDGPVYVLFGATGGIGSALARRLAAAAAARRGGALVVSGHDEARLRGLAAALEGQLGGREGALQAAHADALNPEAVDAVMRRTLERHGRVDGVASCVGSVEAASLLATSPADLDRLLRVNTHTAFNVLKAAVKARARRVMVAETARDPPGAGGGPGPAPGGPGGGSVVLVSAALGGHGVPNYAAMSAAKAAVEGLARSAAATYAARGLRVNTVAPGLVETDQTAGFLDNGRLRGASEAMFPTKQLVTADDVAAAAEFLLGPASRSITGHSLPVDGGLSSLHPHRAQDYGV
ncbi:hypothetical protein Rsub_09207 [Raphidocelis subcapitata]|uniref:Ketoreductase domain-containing protein n=1 Tax=Raphidocelis subcapitata TaxID=307507 RepID=A0A2V0P974_9CHLO|nr:hypothetical protein Rsub_09207 [Raphidocelis subcapitata]|eukprot:GBF96408.1 hypothetical protein Rsub_09207 [Raphidocelis subcapitata]